LAKNQTQEMTKAFNADQFDKDEDKDEFAINNAFSM